MPHLHSVLRFLTTKQSNLNFRDLGSSLLVQEIAYEFLTLCSPTDREEILTAVKTSINNDIESEKFTRESVHLIMAFIWYASNKVSII